MLSLKPFSADGNIEKWSDLGVQADLRLLSQDTFEVLFKWTDTSSDLIFGGESRGGRLMGLWQHTCFEAFIEPVDSPAFVSKDLEGSVLYYELNLSTFKGWNLFGFNQPRLPQPPTELREAQLVSYDLQHGESGGVLKVVVQVAGAQWNKVKISLCSVLVSKSRGTSYWSFKHAGERPDFHRFDSFIIERSYTAERVST